MMTHAADDAIRATPLHMRTGAENRLNQWTLWNGFTYPLTLRGLARETRAARQAAALADISPLAKIEMTGPEAAACMARLCTRDISRLAVGQVAETLWCDGGGWVRGLGAVAVLEQDRFLLLSETADLPWIIDSTLGFDAKVTDLSDARAALVLTGPRAALVLTTAGLDAAAALEAGQCVGVTHKTQNIVALRRNGLPSFELLVEPDEGSALWDSILRAGQEVGIEPMGWSALELWRIESGLPAPGRDFVPAHLADAEGQGVTPSALALGAWVDMKRSHFNGRRAMLARAGEKPRQVLYRMSIETKAEAAYRPIRVADSEAGQTASALWSPHAGATSSLAWVDPEALAAKERPRVLVKERQGMRRIERLAPARFIL